MKGSTGQGGGPSRTANRGTNRARGRAQQGGYVPGLPETPAFTLTNAAAAAIPVLISVPHAGRAYPAGLLSALRHPADAPLRLEDRLVDQIAARLADATGAALLVAHAPRAMIDLNRAPDDMDWDMVADGGTRPFARLGAGRRARTGLGLVPRRLAGLGELWHARLPREELDARISAVHTPYHAALARTLETLRDTWGAALLVDLHSMPPLGPKTGPEAAADFVVGDRFGASCAAHLSHAALGHLGHAGWRAAHNRPYAGGYVLDRHAAPQRGIHAMQVEVCRAVYLDAQLQDPGEGFDAVAVSLAAMVQRLAADLTPMPRGFAQAAE
ncbi:N-formylglutamate amidohydrolase [Alteraurantiacibacter palmitatis]|uniref:N-formylglutamate amidohydrolase n=1 Tax=Alteraurantiacibacter palmitatis TaxID=2054628 RepID=A0ABV7E7E5_9SPHN